MADSTDAARTLRRRGLIAGAAALVAGVAAKQTSLPVAAAPVVAEAFIANGTASNFEARGTATYGLDITGGSFDTAVYGQGITYGVKGFGGAYGVYAIASNSDSTGVGGAGGAYGVDGVATGASGTGVHGHHSTGGYGVYGNSDSGTGVYGTAPSGYGVQGISTSFYGVYGQSKSSAAIVGKIDFSSTFANTIGVYGNNLSTGANGIAVYGSCANGTGVYGQTASSNQYGILGTTYATNSTAIAGTCTANGSSAFSGGTTNPNAYAAVFQGNVVIQGRLIVSDPSYKSGALAHPEGSHRLVYCVESPESWIEDVGKGQLVNGSASVQFDKDFATLMHTDDYHVFLTLYGEGDNGVNVTERRVDGFTVKERKGGVGNQGFSWKVMVKAKSSVKSERLGKFTLPNLLLPDPAKFKVPEMPAAPTPPTPPSAPAPRAITLPAVQSPPSAPAVSPPTSEQQPVTGPPSTGSAPNPLPAPRP